MPPSARCWVAHPEPRATTENAGQSARLRAEVPGLGRTHLVGRRPIFSRACRCWWRRPGFRPCEMVDFSLRRAPGGAPLHDWVGGTGAAAR